jgi:hypothetical protein
MPLTSPEETTPPVESTATPPPVAVDPTAPITGTDDSPLPPITTDRAQVAGMTPTEAHVAILCALDVGMHQARAAAGMVSPGHLAQLAAQLADTRMVLAAHAPYELTNGLPGTWCHIEGAGPDSPHWPCPTYRRHAATIAEGLP